MNTTTNEGKQQKMSKPAHDPARLDRMLGKIDLSHSLSNHMQADFQYTMLPMGGDLLHQT